MHKLTTIEHSLSYPSHDRDQRFWHKEHLVQWCPVQAVSSAASQQAHRPDSQLCRTMFANHTVYSLDHARSIQLTQWNAQNDYARPQGTHSNIHLTVWCCAVSGIEECQWSWPKVGVAQYGRGLNHWTPVMRYGTTILFANWHSDRIKQIQNHHDSLHCF